ARNDVADPRLPRGEGVFFAGLHLRLCHHRHGGLVRRRHRSSSSCARLVEAALHGWKPSLSKIRSGVSGRSGKRMPVACMTALAIAGATGLMEHSPCDLAPSGPMVSYVSAKKISVRGTSAKAGKR